MLFQNCRFVSMMNNGMDLKAINDFSKDTIIDLLGIEVIEVTDKTITGKMPVDKRTHQPMKLLHGGASVVLIESLGSIGSNLLCNHDVEFPVGLEVNANHIGGVSQGNVVGVATILHKGKTTHVWSVEVREENTDRLISSGRLTVMIVAKK